MVTLPPAAADIGDGLAAASPDKFRERGEQRPVERPVVQVRIDQVRLFGGKGIVGITRGGQRGIYHAGEDYGTLPTRSCAADLAPGGVSRASATPLAPVFPGRIPAGVRRMVQAASVPRLDERGLPPDRVSPVAGPRGQLP